MLQVNHHSFCIVPDTLQKLHEVSSSCSLHVETGVHAVSSLVDNVPSHHSDVVAAVPHKRLYRGVELLYQVLVLTLNDILTKGRLFSDMSEKLTMFARHVVFHCYDEFSVGPSVLHPNEYIRL